MTTPLRMPPTVDGRWTKSQVIFLLTHYQIMGDVEISELMNVRFPRASLPWTRKHIAKKRSRLELYRTGDQLTAIRQRNNQQQRYSTEAARQKYQQERNQVTPCYVMSQCLRFRKHRHPEIIQKHGLLVELTRNAIIKKRAERNNYAVQ
jgi:hypothetical protein